MMYYTCYMEIDPNHKNEFKSLTAREVHLCTALPNYVRLENSGMPIPSFLAVTHEEACNHVANYLPYFKEEEWLADEIFTNGEWHNGWTIRKDRIELMLIEQEVEDMALDDMELFLSVLCKHVHQCLVENKIPDRIISYNPEDNV